MDWTHTQKKEVKFMSKQKEQNDLKVLAKGQEPNTDPSCVCVSGPTKIK